MNLAPLLATSLDDSLAPADETALDVWREQWEQAVDWLGASWEVDDAVDWVRDTTALTPLFRAQSFDGIIETGAGLARGYVELGLPIVTGAEEWEFWDETVQLRDGGVLAYPNDAERVPSVSFYAPIVHGDGPGPGPIRLATLVFELEAPRVIRRVRLRDDADGACARYLVTSTTGERELSCESLSCPHDCERRTWVRPGGVRRSRCAC
jgi:hypothetical protein